MAKRKEALLAAGAIALATLLAACRHAAPTAPLTAARAGLPLGAQAEPGRLLVRWRDPKQAAAVLQKLGLSEQPIDGSDESVVTLDGDVSADALQAAAGAAIASSEPDYELHEYLVPNDPLFAQQYALPRIEAPAAWSLTRGNPRVKIAIVDTGCDVDHPDLRAQIAGTYDAIARDAGGVRDDNGHGTHCAGVAAAQADNRVGISGVAPGCKLLIVKALDAEGNGASSDIARGVSWAVAQGASVISLSMGTEHETRALREAIEHAIDRGVVVVAAMGNEGRTQRNYPAAFPGVIAVGATDRGDRVADFSTRGDWISVCAPGVDILSTTPSYPVALTRELQLAPNYGVLSGTSMATPLVAGLAALVRSEHPAWTPAQVKADLENTAVGDGVGSVEGHGRVDALAALR